MLIEFAIGDFVPAAPTPFCIIFVIILIFPTAAAIVDVSEVDTLNICFYFNKGRIVAILFIL